MPLRIQAIVCAVDFSPFSPLVVSHGVTLARRAGVRLYLLHAVHDPQDGAHPITLFERGGDLTYLTGKAGQEMEALMAAHASVRWDAVVRFGDPVEEMVAFVNSLPPGLVVSASHGVSGFRRLFVGTVVERLTRELNRPMLVVKPTGDAGHQKPDGFRSAVVSCDGHGHWQRLAPMMRLLQTEAGPRFHLVHALEGPMAEPSKGGVARSYGNAQQAQNDRLSHQLREQARRLFSYTDKIAVAVEPGVPHEMVLRIARERESDVIVVGVRHSGKVGRWISGSTTEALLRHSPCCVLTVPEPPQSGKPRGAYG